MHAQDERLEGGKGSRRDGEGGDPALRQLPQHSDDAALMAVGAVL